MSLTSNLWDGLKQRRRLPKDFIKVTKQANAHLATEKLTAKPNPRKQRIGKGSLAITLAQFGTKKAETIARFRSLATNKRANLQGYVMRDLQGNLIGHA